MDKIEEIFGKINLKALLQENIPLAEKTTFKAGGSARWFFAPSTLDQAREGWSALKTQGLTPVILGRGANVLVSDKGIPGLVFSLENLGAFSLEDGLIRAQAGCDPSEIARWAQPQGLSSLEFLYSMPSSLGGAVYMNARCYDREISQIFHKARGVDAKGQWQTLTRDQTQWDYKDSPFMHRDILILEIWLETTSRAPQEILKEMKAHEDDRTQKGHFTAPCAGSYFKNDRSFGAPTGVIVDKSGLKGLTQGGAQVAPWHGNILINREAATATDIRLLGERVKKSVFETQGFHLEEEVIFLGDWSDWSPETL